MFIRRKTRLNTDVINTLSMLSSAEHIQNWTTHMPAQIEIVNDNLVTWRYGGDDEMDLTFEFHLMQCAENTEYCTEIHLLLKTVESMGTLNKNIIERAEKILEAIRYKFNRSWIIEDKDLNSSLLKTR